MSDPFAPVARVFAELATRVSAQAIESDPRLRARLQALDGQCLELQCTAPPSTWHVIVTDGTLLTQPGAAPAPQVIVRGHAMALAAALAPGSPAAGQLEINGDNTLALELLDILRDFQPDLAEPMSRIFGPDAAATLVGTAELGLKSMQSLLSGVGQSMSDTAAANFVRSTQLDNLLTGIDRLRLRVDRLAAKVTEFEQQQK